MKRQFLEKHCKKRIVAGLIVAFAVCAGIPVVYLQSVDADEQNVSADANLAEGSSQKKADSASDASESETSDGAAASKNTDSEADRADKTETVYVTADASGKTQEISVEAVLKNPGGTSPIEDVSALTDIKNTEGDEEFTQEKDGTLTWENHGEDITYKGDSDAELPVSVKVTYYLDGEEISASKLAGKSGEVKIRFDYENQTAEEEMIPFAVISAAVLPDDVFSDVTVTNGKLISMDGQNLVIGYAFPGLSDALGTEDYEPLEDFEIPEYVEITAQAEDFALDFTATIVSNGLLEELDEDSLDDADDLTDSMDELADASDELVDGAAQLLSASQSMSNYLKEYTDGVSAVSDGAQTLADGIRALNENSDAILSGTEGAQALLSSVDLSAVEAAANETARAQVRESANQAIVAELAQVEGLTEEQKAQIAASAAETIASSVDVSGVSAEEQAKVAAIQTTWSQLQSGIAAYTAGVNQVSSGADTLASGAAQLETVGASLTEGGNALADGISALKEGLTEFDEEGIEKLTELAGDDLAEIISRLRTLKNTDAQYDNFSGLKEGQTGSVRFIIETEEIE